MLHLSRIETNPPLIADFFPHHSQLRLPYVHNLCRLNIDYPRELHRSHPSTQLPWSSNLDHPLHNNIPLSHIIKWLIPYFSLGRCIGQNILTNVPRWNVCRIERFLRSRNPLTGDIKSVYYSGRVNFPIVSGCSGCPWGRGGTEFLWWMRRAFDQPGTADLSIL